MSYMTSWGNSHNHSRHPRPRYDHSRRNMYHRGYTSNQSFSGSNQERGSFYSPSLPQYGQGGNNGGRRPPNGNPGPLPPGQGNPIPGQGSNPSQVPYFSNLENNLALPQGWQRAYAQPTSISSLITGLLYQSRQDPQNYWNTAFGAQQTQGGTSYRANSSYGQGPYNGGAWSGNWGSGRRSGGGSYQRGGSSRYQRGSNYGSSRQGSFSSGGSYQGGSQGFQPAGSGLEGRNPWGYGKGASTGDYGVQTSGGNTMYQSTQEALSLADAYFAPKRLQLAYELGDMETDMRRLAVNLGRQVDDPVLQAKMYKEAMMSVRTLDSEQNTFSIQMIEQRRKEEMQNRQFYDSLALEEYKSELQADQFEQQLKLQKRQLAQQSQGA